MTDLATRNRFVTGASEVGGGPDAMALPLDSAASEPRRPAMARRQSDSPRLKSRHTCGR